MSHKNNAAQLADILAMGEKMGERMSQMEATLAKLGIASQGGATPAEVFAQQQVKRAKQKGVRAIGWGESGFLNDVFISCCSPGPDAEARMEKHGSKPVNKTAMSGASGGVGGYTIPAQYSDQLLAAAIEESFIAPMCTTLPMTARSAYIPVLKQSGSIPTDGTAFIGGVSLSWTEEAGNTSQTEPTFEQIELIAHELTGYSEISNSLLQDSAIALDSLLTTLLARALGWARDYFVLRGNGVGKPLGVVNAPCTVQATRTSAGRFKLADAANMLSQLLPGSMDRACWVMSQTLIPDLIQMADEGGNVVFIPNYAVKDASGGGATFRMPMMLLGKPIFFTEKLPALGTLGDVVLADFSQYLVGDRMELSIEASREAKFRTNQMAWRCVARWDGQPWLKQALTLADGTTSVSPFVTLAA